MKVIYKGQVKLVQTFYEKVLSFSTWQSLHYLTMQIQTWETQYLIWTGCHVFFNHLLHEPLQPRIRWRQSYSRDMYGSCIFTDTLILVLHYSIFQTVTQPRLSIHVHNCCVISPLSISCRRQNWFPAVLPMTCQITGQQGSVYISLVEWWQK